MRFGSVCSGIEAASAAWHPLGWEAAWFSEIEPFPCAVLKHHYPTVPNLGDMTALPERIRSGEVEAPALFCGGTPCQAFSVAGLRRSLADQRGNLSLTFCEIADAIDDVRRARGEQPCIVFWENVPGVLSTSDNAFGCFISALAGCDTAVEPLAATGWTDAGVVAGPRRTVSWRILDAQYFGLAQRRRRVFIVASAREGFEPAAVLLEWEGLRRDTAPSREAGQSVAAGAADSTGVGSAVGTIGCNTGPRGHGFGDFLNNQSVDAGHIMAFGGGQNCAATDVSTALSAHPGGSRLDFQTETFVAHSLRGEGYDASEDVTGRGTPLVPVTFRADAMREGTAKTPSPDAEGRVRLRDPGMGMYEDIAPTLDCGAAHGVAHAFDARQSDVIQYGDKTGPLDTNGHTVELLAFDTTQITSAANYSNPKPGDPCHPLAAGAHPPAIAFSAKDHGADAGEIAPTLRAMGHGSSHANGGGQVAVLAPTLTASNDPSRSPQSSEITAQVAAVVQATATFIQDDATPKVMDNIAGYLRRDAGGEGPCVMQSMQVRRLTPVECERLMGFPDNYTAIPWRGKPADQCPDGPRYKALGNSWAVPVVRWIGQRIAASVPQNTVDLRPHR